MVSAASTIVYFTITKNVGGVDIPVIRYPIWPGEQLIVEPKSYVYVLEEAYRARQVGDLLSYEEVAVNTLPVDITGRAEVSVTAEVAKNGLITLKQV